MSLPVPGLFPSLISADLLHLGDTIETLNPHCSGYHIDIMDDHFVPNLTWGAQFANAIAGATTNEMWVHLMIENPERMIKSLDLPDGSIVTFHVETKKEIEKVASLILEKNWRPSLAINPKTEIERGLPYLGSMIDHLLIMSVEPGFSGQTFIPNTYHKVEKANKFRELEELDFTIAVDGGINETNIQELTRKGAEHFAIASAIFGKHDSVAMIKHLYHLLRHLDESYLT